MLSDHLKSELNSLSRGDKLRVVQMLVEQLASEEELLNAREYEVWSPYDSAEAARILNEMLEEDQRQRG